MRVGAGRGAGFGFAGLLPHPVDTLGRCGEDGFGFGREGEAPHPVDTEGFDGFAGLLGVDVPQPVETDDPRVLLPFARSSWPDARSDSPFVFFASAAVAFGFQPPLLELPQPVETDGFEGFLSSVTLPLPVPQPVDTGFRVAFPTVMRCSPWVRSGTSCRVR
mgnify:CR=1 FL=1